jgi:DNA-binding PadR family transcriptional regulator
MRNPDYLANELLNEYERERDATLLDEARAIYESREPDLRRLPMVRYLFGAFEPLDDALALLRAHDFVRIHREGVPGERIREHVYLLTERGRAAMAQLSALGPELDWYAKRAELVMRVAGGAGGKMLKDRQYLQLEYAATELGKPIAPIAERVRSRLDELTGGRNS